MSVILLQKYAYGCKHNDNLLVILWTARQTIKLVSNFDAIFWISF